MIIAPRQSVLSRAFKATLLKARKNFQKFLKNRHPRFQSSLFFSFLA